MTESNALRADRIIAIGEVKATASPMGSDQLARLEHLRELLPGEGTAGQVRLLLVSQSGFAPALAQQAQQREDVELVDLERLYRGE